MKLLLEIELWLQNGDRRIFTLFIDGTHYTLHNIRTKKGIIYFFIADIHRKRTGMQVLFRSHSVDYQ